MQTKKTYIVNGLRLIWLHSAERRQALKNKGYCCEVCGVKQSKAKGNEVKISVHHKEGVGNWDRIVEVIKEELLCSPDKMEVLCKQCHKEKHKK